MSDPSENKHHFKDTIFNKYRIVILDDDTLAEKKSLKLSVFWLCLGTLLSLLLLSSLIFTLIIYSPVRFLIPGYGDIGNNKVYIELNEKINTLEKDIRDQRVFTEGFKNMLNPSNLSSINFSNRDSISKRFSPKAAKEYISNKNINLGHYYFCSPLNGEVSANFDISNKHFGVDIVARKDTPVKSILDGVVINADWSTNTGHTISVQHSDNMISVYKHNSVLLKKIGDKVNSCDAIAIIGNTGKLTTGPHVHFELWKNGIALNPTKYINFKY